MASVLIDADLDLGNVARVINVANPSSAQDVVTRDFLYDQVQSIWLSLPGVQVVGAGVLPLYFPYTVEITNFHLSTLANATITLDVNRSGTTMFVTQANRPSLSAGQTDATSTPDAATNNQLTTSQYLTVDVDVATGSPSDLMLRCDYVRV